MKDCADLELGIHRADVATYVVDFRFSQPDSDADIHLGRDSRVELKFNLQELQNLLYSPDEYSQALTNFLFSNENIRTAFAQAWAATQAQDVSMRFRLLIGPSAPELHNLHWELLRNPQTNSLITTNENILFSRYLASLDWRPVRLHPKGNLRALVMVSGPGDLANYKLTDVNVAVEIAQARDGLAGIELDILPTESKRVTLNNLSAQLHVPEKGYDIVYLVCHGTLVSDKPFLILEDDDGKTKSIPGQDFVTRIKELKHRPRLVVLVSCQSAGKSTGDTMTALGPRLAEIGIPAVIAMQDNLTMQTANEFLPTFFKELQNDGQIDRAMAVARGQVRERPDHWVPVLFMRLKSGRLWYTPGFSGGQKGFEKFPAELRNIKRGRCTPILGPGLVESMFGAQNEIALRWAEDFRYPLTPHGRESLPQVAQYLTINQAISFPLDEYEDYLKKHIRKTMGDKLPPALTRPSATLTDLIEALGLERRKTNPNEPHKLLAELPISIFITANQDTLLEAALLEAGKDPQSILCPWNPETENLETIYTREPNYQPSSERPMVFHLFGRWDEPYSIVLTEDSYFRFLIGFTRNKQLIPGAVRQALGDSGLLFLGFQTEEWAYRILFQSIQNQVGEHRRALYAQIAAQIEPDDDRILEPQRARKYFEQYFKGAAIDIYWGNAEEFLEELLKLWRKNQ